MSCYFVINFILNQTPNLSNYSKYADYSKNIFDELGHLVGFIVIMVKEIGTASKILG